MQHAWRRHPPISQRETSSQSGCLFGLTVCSSAKDLPEFGGAVQCVVWCIKAAKQQYSRGVQEARVEGAVEGAVAGRGEAASQRGGLLEEDMQAGGSDRSEERARSRAVKDHVMQWRCCSNVGTGARPQGQAAIAPSPQRPGGSP